MTYFIISLVLSYLGAVFLGQFIEISNNWYFSLIMITSALGIILTVLKEQNELTSRMGQMIISVAATSDILNIILFTFTAFIKKKVFSPKTY